jgi:hypothetical protein
MIRAGVEHERVSKGMAAQNVWGRAAFQPPDQIRTATAHTLLQLQLAGAHGSQGAWLATSEPVEPG